MECGRQIAYLTVQAVHCMSGLYIYSLMDIFFMLWHLVNLCASKNSLVETNPIFLVLDGILL